MGDIRRVPNDNSVHNVHLHNCPNCKRNYSCNCHTQPERWSLACVDCERGTYNPVVHGGQGERSEA